MSSIIITLKRNTVTIQEYYSLILIVWYIKLKLVYGDFSKDKKFFI